MKLILVALLAVALTGCATTAPPVEQNVVVQYKYIVNTVPEDLFTLPAPVAPLNLSTATDKDAALWIVASERRALEIEERLKEVKRYLDEKIKSIKLDPKDIIWN